MPRYIRQRARAWTRLPAAKYLAADQRHRALATFQFRNSNDDHTVNN